MVAVGVGVTNLVMVVWNRDTVTSWVVEVTVVGAAAAPFQAAGMTVLTYANFSKG